MRRQLQRGERRGLEARETGRIEPAGLGAGARHPGFVRQVAADFGQEEMGDRLARIGGDRGLERFGGALEEDARLLAPLVGVPRVLLGPPELIATLGAGEQAEPEVRSRGVAIELDGLCPGTFGGLGVASAITR